MGFETWHQGNYLISTDPELLQVEAVNAALESDMVWWAGGLPTSALEKALKNSLCFGIYQRTSTGESSNEPLGQPLSQIGLVRIVTDYVTFAHITDVYILDGCQGAGLGRRALGVVNKKLRSWPRLRRAMLLTTDKLPLFNKNLGMKDYRECDGMEGVSIAMVEGPGAQH